MAKQHAKKMLVIDMPDGSKWAVAVEVVAHDRADFYRDGGYQKEFDLAMADPRALIDWAGNEMNWSDVQKYAQQYRPPDPLDAEGFQEGWVNGEKHVLDVPCHMLDRLTLPECK